MHSASLQMQVLGGLLFEGRRNNCELYKWWKQESDTNKNIV